eukprot:1158462-Pelagomonas_calceolata.AAC.2
MHVERTACACCEAVHVGDPGREQLEAVFGAGTQSALHAHAVRSCMFVGACQQAWDAKITNWSQLAVQKFLLCPATQLTPLASWRAVCFGHAPFHKECVWRCVRARVRVSSSVMDDANACCHCLTQANKIEAQRWIANWQQKQKSGEGAAPSSNGKPAAPPAAPASPAASSTSSQTLANKKEAQQHEQRIKIPGGSFQQGLLRLAGIQQQGGRSTASERLGLTKAELAKGFPATQAIIQASVSRSLRPCSVQRPPVIVGSQFLLFKYIA